MERGLGTLTRGARKLQERSGLEKMRLRSEPTSSHIDERIRYDEQMQQMGKEEEKEPTIPKCLLYICLMFTSVSPFHIHNSSLVYPE